MVDEKTPWQGITYDDVLLVPAYSDHLPTEVTTKSKFSRNIEINIPICSSPMDTVTMAPLAIALAQEGGIGVIHKNLTPEKQGAEVQKVKRSANGVILNPVILPPDATLDRARSLMREFNISGIPVVQKEHLVGILTHRDLRFEENLTRPISDVMTKSPLISAPIETTLEEARAILSKNKVEKLLLVDEAMKLKGLITMKDIDKLEQFPNATRDTRGRLRVGAAVGVNDLERIEELIRREREGGHRPRVHLHDAGHCGRRCPPGECHHGSQQGRERGGDSDHRGRRDPAFRRHPQGAGFRRQFRHDRGPLRRPG
jgi:IMP dehydrogenase